MDLLSRLPTCLSGSALSEWVDLRDVTRLDSAFCNRTNRTAFLNLLKSDECVSCDCLKWNHMNTLRWVILRDVKLKNVICGSEDDCEMLWQLHNSGFSVRSLELLCPLSTSLPFQNLVALTCHSLSELVCGLIENNPNLEKLTLKNHDNSEAELSAAFYAPSLRGLEVHNSNCNRWRCDHDCSSLLYLVQAGKLRSLKLEYFNPGDAMANIAYSCPLLENLDLSCELIPDETLQTIAGSCILVKTLRLSGCGEITDSGLQILLSSLKLQCLTLIDCTSLTSYSARNIAEHCSDTLTNLTVVQKWMDADIAGVLQSRCTNLINFDWDGPYCPSTPSYDIGDEYDEDDILDMWYYKYGRTYDSD